MKRKSKFFLILFLLLSVFTVFAFSLGLKVPDVYIDEVKVPERARLIKGVVYLPIYVLASVLQMDIERDFSLHIVKINGELIDAVPYESPEGEVLLPVEAVVKSVGGVYLACGKDNSVRISTRGEKQVRPVERRPVIEIPTQSGLPAPVPSPGYEPTPAPLPPTPVIPEPPVYPPAYPTPSIPVYPPFYPSPAPTPSISPSESPYQPPPPPPPAIKTPSWQGSEVFIPRTVRNNVFIITATNMEVLNEIKSYYRPREGYKFVIIYVSQQNISNEVQIYTGNFTLLDLNSREYYYAEGLSNFWLVILSPGGTNFGYLVYEIPRDAVPNRLVLKAVNLAPLTLNLHREAKDEL